MEKVHIGKGLFCTQDVIYATIAAQKDIEKLQVIDNLDGERVMLLKGPGWPRSSPKIKTTTTLLAEAWEVLNSLRSARSFLVCADFIS